MKRLLLAMLFAAFAMPVLGAQASLDMDIDDDHGRMEHLEDYGSNLGLNGLPMVECAVKRAKLREEAATRAREAADLRQLVRGS